MKNVLFLFLLSVLVYACSELSGKEPQPRKRDDARSTHVHAVPPDHLRVGKDRAMRMRGRRDKDDQALKMAVSDILSLANGAPREGDSLIFYFVKYDKQAADERDRYLARVPGANWNEVTKKPSSLLVGYVRPAGGTGMLAALRPPLSVVDVYDLGVVCPPPPDCACEIRQ